MLNPSVEGIGERGVGAHAEELANAESALYPALGDLPLLAVNRELHSLPPPMPSQLLTTPSISVDHRPAIRHLRL